MYGGKLYKPMQELSKMTDAYSKAAVGYERIREVLDADAELKDLRGARQAPKLKGAIEFENVSFRYNSDAPILNNVSFRIEPGQQAALVGPPGAGKREYIRLIPALFVLA